MPTCPLSIRKIFWVEYLCDFILQSSAFSETAAYGGPGGDLRWRSSLRLAPAPPIYGVMGDYGSPPGHPAAASQCHVDLRTFNIQQPRVSPESLNGYRPENIPRGSRALGPCAVGGFLILEALIISALRYTHQPPPYFRRGRRMDIFEHLDYQPLIKLESADPCLSGFMSQYVTAEAYIIPSSLKILLISDIPFSRLSGSNTPVFSALSFAVER